MNRNDDFDQTLAAWLRSEAPPQAPDRVLDAALERVAAQSQQRDWLQRLVGGTRMTTLLRAGAVAAVVAIAAFIGFRFSDLSPDVGGSPSPSASATAAPDGSPTPLPSQSSSPTPSEEPAVAALVLRLEGGGESGRFHLTTVLEDGRTITSSDDQFDGTPSVERRLTAAGVQLVRDELDATGLSFLASADYSPVSRPGVDPPAYGGAGPALVVGLPGGGTAVISWYLFADTEQNYFKPQPEAEALAALAARLSTLDEWLPANAWADADASPYAPAQYRIFIYSTPYGGSLDNLAVESSTVSWPLIEGIDVYGDVVEIVTQETGDIGPYPRCRVVSAEEGTAVIAALEAAGAAPSVEHLIPGTSLELGYRATSRQVVINLEPILPLIEASCGREIPF